MYFVPGDIQVNFCLLKVFCPFCVYLKSYLAVENMS